ncbi:MAG: polymer-forming cytoskeletal protein [Patescibacteria group bacterium]
MFKKDEPSYNLEEAEAAAGGEEAETVIAAGVRVDGNFNSRGNVLIEGIVKGSIKTDRDLKIGEKAKIYAAVAATNIYVSGEVQGNIKATGRLELAETARIFGDAEVKILVVAPGAVLNGKCSMIGVEAPAALDMEKEFNRGKNAKDKE